MKTKCAKQPLVSVIVPVYKVEAYLRTCVDSILEQPYENIEIILVDDGSPDRCPMICEEYAKKDPRIRVIHQENRGLPAARNTGLRAAPGSPDGSPGYAGLFLHTLRSSSGSNLANHRPQE